MTGGFLDASYPQPSSDPFLCEAIRRADEQAPLHAAICDWWLDLPSFLKPCGPFEVPLEHRTDVREILTQAGAPRFCPNSRCRRTKMCQGSADPACYRADRPALQHVLLLAWLEIRHNLDDVVADQELRDCNNRYAPSSDKPPAAKNSPRSSPRRKRRR